ncbi:MAG: RluA family pseudouridine synthase, partial [Candidatus Harrisonbacteria bacterium]|nr:RluA family pseudouridine synthase [Candidatus Harrisonbacteria bacterium]
KMAKEAVTRYRVEKEITKNGEQFSLLTVSPETGRTHQIRVHCASIGHPVVGDALYGRRRRANRDSRSAPPRLMLHALSLELPLPSGSMVHLEAEPPEEFAHFGGTV